MTLVAGLRLRGLTAAKTFDGPINAALFEDWLETCLVPTLSPGEIVVMRPALAVVDSPREPEIGGTLSEPDAIPRSS